MNEPTRILICDQEIYQYNQAGWLGYPNAWSFVLIPLTERENCGTKVVSFSNSEEINLNPVYLGTYQELILQRLKEDLFMLVLSFFLLMASLICATLCIVGKGNKKLTLVFFIHIFILLYTISIANSSFQIFIKLPNQLWPFIFFNSLMVLPIILSDFFRMFFTTRWMKAFSWMRNIFIAWIPFQLILVNVFDTDFYNLFNFFTIL